MIPITKSERKALDNVGLIKYRRVGINAQDANIQIANREHMSRAKTDYITEEPEIMKFLGHFENFNMQRISNSQLKQLKDKGMATEDNIQKVGEYKPTAFIYIKCNGTILMDKIAKYMIFLGIWKNQTKR